MFGTASSFSTELPWFGRWRRLWPEERAKNSPTGPVFLMVSGRVRRFLRRCSVGLGLGVGAVTAGTVAVPVSSGAAVGVAKYRIS